MEANVYSGEIGVSWGERDVVFRPSFLAISRLGEPDELLGVLRDIQFEGPSELFPFSVHRAFMLSLRVLDACAVNVSPEDMQRLTGHFREVQGRLRYVMGAMSLADIRIIAVRLIVAGMIGKPRKSSEKQDKASSTFDPGEFAATAQAHLGMPYRDAWHMTMIDFQRAMDAKFPPKDGDKEKEQPTQEEAAAAVDHVAAIRKRIAEKKSPG